MLSNSTLGITGYGKIGEECAKIAKKAFNMYIIAMKRDPKNSTLIAKEYVNEIVGTEDFDRVLMESDYLINICPLVKETDKMFD